MAKWWHEKPMRLVQTNLRQIDISRDPREIVREVKDFGGNAILFSVGGIVSFYPSELEFQTPIPGLKGDFVGEAVQEAHEQGIRFIARLDLSKCHKHVYDSHPEWFFKRVDSKPIIYNGVYSTCINGGYYREYSFEIMKEVIGRYDVDGFFFNMFGYQTSDYSGNYHGLCQCVNCQKRFREMFGHPLPQEEDPNDPVYRDFSKFRAITSDEMSQTVREFIRTSKENMVYLRPRGESNSSVRRALPMWQYSGSDNVKRARGTYLTRSDSSIDSNAAVYFLDIPYRFASVSLHLTALRLAQDLANGGGIDLYVLGTLDQEDKMAIRPAKEIFNFFAEHEEVYHNLESLAKVCLISGGSQDYRGVFRLLTENHIPFDSVSSSLLNEDDADVGSPTARKKKESEQSLEKYDLMILPGGARLSGKQGQTIDQFVHGGGRLLMAGDAAFLDEEGLLADGCGLQCIGVEKAVMRGDNMRSAYFRIHDSERMGVFPETDLMFLDGSYLHATVKEGAASLWTLVPPSVYGPPEKVFIDKEESDWPGVINYAYGEGKTAYFPWNIGRLYYRYSSPGHEKAFLSVLLDLCDGQRQIITNAHPLVEINLFAQAEGKYVLNLVNSSGHQSTAFFEPVPMSDIEVKVKLPERPQSASSLKLDKEIPLLQEGEYTCIRLERLELFDTILMK